MQNFILYQKARKCNKAVTALLNNPSIDPYKRDQLKRCSNSFVFNIAEANGRITPKDRANFFGIARGSVLETYAGIEMLEDEQNISEEISNEQKEMLDELIKMLTIIMNNQSKGKKDGKKEIKII